MDMMHAAPRKQTLRNWKAQDWVEHASFGLGQISESREDKLDIEAREDVVRSGHTNGFCFRSPGYSSTIRLWKGGRQFAPSIGKKGVFSRAISVDAAK
jgi:hypothetical protein